MAVLDNRFCAIFSEKIILLLNREEASAVTITAAFIMLSVLLYFVTVVRAGNGRIHTVYIEIVSTHPPHVLQDMLVLLQFLQLVYASPGRGSSFLYTNDLRVVVEVLVRGLMDRPVDDPVSSVGSGNSGCDRCGFCCFVNAPPNVLCWCSW